MNATVLMRRKANNQNRQSKITEAIATPPSSVASPSRPIAVVETIPISGVVRLATIAGPAIAKTWAELTLGKAVNEIGLRAIYRPRGAPSRRDRNQIGMTITAPSRK